MPVKVGIDTNVFIKLFEDSETLNLLKDKGYLLYTNPKCLWEMCKYIKSMGLKDTNTEGIVSRFMERNGIEWTSEEVDIEEIRAFEEECKNLGINCHYPDSEFVLVFKKEGISIIYSDDHGFRKSAEILGMKACRLKDLELTR